MNNKLDLYKRFLLQSDKAHLTIRGITGLEYEKEVIRLKTQIDTITKVPTKYTVKLLEGLIV